MPAIGLRNKRFFRFCALPFGLVLVGCANPYHYAQSSSLTPQNAATLIGSRIHDPNPFKLDALIMPSKIDGLIMGSQWYNDSSSRWNKAFLISPGTHQIMAAISLGGTFDQSAWGSADFSIVFQPGKKYQIMATAPTPIPGSNTLLLSYAWLQDDAGKVLTSRIPVEVGVYTGGDMIGIPSVGGQPQIFLPPHS